MAEALVRETLCLFVGPIRLDFDRHIEEGCLVEYLFVIGIGSEGDKVYGELPS